MAIVAVGQICSTISMAHNLSQCRLLVQKAVAAGAKALFLPEASDYIAPTASETVSSVRPASSSPFVQGLQASAREHNLPINVGIHEPSSKHENKVINSLVWINADGQIEHRYQKLHLFDVDIPGGPTLQESNSVEKGTEILAPFPTAVGNVGLLICFDLRFPEPSISLRRQGAHIITYPSAFTAATGRAHWSALLRARAIETQSYVVAAAQVGSHNDKRTSYGHSMIVSPWGDIVAELGGEKKDEPEIAVGEIDLERMEKIRKEMPLLRRTDVYPEV
ncbi:Carbon-nitrogen hydrolase [Xanthoria parietina]